MTRCSLPSFQYFGRDIFELLGNLRVWSCHSRDRRVFHLIFVAYLFALNFLLIISEILDVGNYHDLSSFAAHINPLFLHFLGLFKWSYCIIRRADIVGLVECMERCHLLAQQINLQDVDCWEYRLKLNRCQKYSTLFMNVWLFVAIGGVCQWCTNPIVYDFYEQYYSGKIIESSAMRRLPYPGLFPWEINSISRYVMCFAFQLWGGIASTVGVAVFDILNLTFMMYACAQLNHLKDTLIAKSEKPDESYNKIQIHQLGEKLMRCIRHHCQVLIFLKKLEEFSSGPMFVQCLGIIVALCLISFEASTIQFNGSIEPVMKTIMMFEYWCSIVAELFLYCYMASELGQLVKFNYLYSTDKNIFPKDK
uniref:Odorant receptor n=1 Tax=Fopius arisanus TaxID=64838 RepID=A0A0C9RJN2_9HYME